MDEIPYQMMWQDQLLNRISWWNPSRTDIVKLQLYTDGSSLWSKQTGQMNAGWGVVVVACDSWDNCHLVGMIASHVITDRGDPLCTGATKNDSDSAEADALIWAAIWALQRPHDFENLEIEFISDSKTKVKAADGSWNAQVSPQFLVLHAVMISLSRTSKLRDSWTKAHSGNLYNELADHVTKSAARFPDEFWPRAPMYDILSSGLQSTQCMALAVSRSRMTIFFSGGPHRSPIREKNSARALDQASSIPLDIQQVPSLVELEQALRRSTPGNAHFGCSAKMAVFCCKRMCYSDIPRSCRHVGVLPRAGSHETWCLFSTLETTW